MRTGKVIAAIMALTTRAGCRRRQFNDLKGAKDELAQQSGHSLHRCFSAGLAESSHPGSA